MKRNMDVIRKIALALNDADGLVSAVDGVSEDEFNYNAHLMIEAGLAKGRALQVDQSINPVCVDLFRLTWAGHDFADVIKDDTIWNKAKEHVMKPAAAWSFGVLLEYLKVEAKTRIPGLNGLL